MRWGIKHFNKKRIKNRLIFKLQGKEGEMAHYRGKLLYSGQLYNNELY